MVLLDSVSGRGGAAEHDWRLWSVGWRAKERRGGALREGAGRWRFALCGCGGVPSPTRDGVK